MNARALRTVALFLGALGLIGWIMPAGAFNYAHMATAGGRSVSAAVVSDQTALVAPSLSTCKLAKAQVTAQTCQVLIYNNATATMTISFSLQTNNMAGPTPTWTVDSVSTGTTRTSAAKSLGQWAYFNLTYSSSPCVLNPCSQYGNWQINGTSSSTNVLATHEDAYNLTIQFN